MLLPRFRSGSVSGYECPSDLYLPLCLQKHIDDSRGSCLSSESELDSSEHDEDKPSYSDDSNSPELQEWHGFQDTTSDSVNCDGESKPVLYSDRRPVPAPSSSGTS
jgi:hypothetical protein